MKTSLSFFFLSAVSLVNAHGDHDAGPKDGESMEQYAQRHMSKEHHIDTFDTRSFFQLHDLNRDGFWDRDEIEAIYGVHHVYSQKQSKDEIEHQKKADYIADTVLALLDQGHKDGKITVEELEKIGLQGLPNFDHVGAEGHHYDVESEFFLHHEEEYHSTPETQTDESYNHPEDIEHFGHHEEIERKEAEKEAEFQGLSVEEVLDQHEHPEKYQEAPTESQVDPEFPANPKVTRVVPPEQLSPQDRFKNAKAEAEKKGDWGAGDMGFQPPSDASDRMRKNLPYKYKFKRSWGDF